MITRFTILFFLFSIPLSFFSLSLYLCLSLSFSLSVSPPINSDRGRNYYFLTSTKRLILQRSIYRTLRWHRTSANGTANDCVLLVPLHLPHYTQFSAGDLIGFPLILLRFLPARSSPRFIFFSFFPFSFYMRSLALSVGRSFPFENF